MSPIACRSRVSAHPEAVQCNNTKAMLTGVAAPDIQGTQCFRAKIGFDNGASQALFQRLGFREVCRVAVFREVTLEWRPEAADKELLAQRWRSAVKTSYDDMQPDSLRQGAAGATMAVCSEDIIR